jgi:hypothetical protein
LLKEFIFQEKWSKIFVAASVWFIYKNACMPHWLFVSFRLEADNLTFIAGIPP